MAPSAAYFALLFALGSLVVGGDGALVRIAHTQTLNFADVGGGAETALTLLMEADITGRVEVTPKTNRKFDLSFAVGRVLGVSSSFDALASPPPSSPMMTQSLNSTSSEESASAEETSRLLLWTLIVDFLPSQLRANYASTDAQPSPTVGLLARRGSKISSSAEKLSDVLILTTDDDGEAEDTVAAAAAHDKADALPAASHEAAHTVAAAAAAATNSSDASAAAGVERWQLRLSLVPSTFCAPPSRLFGDDACEAHFHLHNYSLRAALSVTRRNSTEEIVDVWAASDASDAASHENYWDSGATKSAFRCGNTSLALGAPAARRDQFLRFEALRLTVIVGGDAKFPYFSSAYAECATDAPSTLTTRLLGAFGGDHPARVALAALALALALALCYRARARHSLLACGSCGGGAGGGHHHHRYNVAVSPFTLDDFDDVDTAPFTENKKSKNFIRGIY